MITEEITIQIVDWKEGQEKLTSVRRRVFVEEQRVPETLELDGRDPEMIHALALHGEHPVGTARMDRDGHIGRVAVLKEYRGRRIGDSLMEALEEEARRIGLKEIRLNAQVSAEGFYSRRGYVREGAIFEEAGINHITMSKKTDK